MSGTLRILCLSAPPTGQPAGTVCRSFSYLGDLVGTTLDPALDHLCCFFPGRPVCMPGRHWTATDG